MRCREYGPNDTTGACCWRPCQHSHALWLYLTPPREGEVLVYISPDEMQCWQDSARFIFHSKAVELCSLATLCSNGAMHGKRPRASWVPYKTVWGCSFSNDGAEPPPSPFPRNLVIVAHKNKIAVKEQAAFHFASDGVWMVFSIGVSFSTVRAKLSSLFESQKEWVYRHKSHRSSYLHQRILSWSTSETGGSTVDL